MNHEYSRIKIGEILDDDPLDTSLDVSREKSNTHSSYFWHYIAIAFLALAVLWYFFSLVHPLHAINQDLGRFITISQEIFETHSISSLNTFSYTHPDFSFVHSHWLGGVFLALIASLVGFSGLVLVKTAVVLLAFMLALRLAYKRSLLDKTSRIVLLGLISLPTIVMLLERTHARPEIFSHLFFVIVLSLLYSKRARLLWLIPLIMLVWVNTHIYFLVGFLLIGAHFLESLYESRFSKRTIHLFGVGASSLFLSLLNPAGLQGLLYPFNVFKNYGYTIVENQTPFFLIPFNYHHGVIATLFIMVVVLLVSFALNWRRIKISDVIISLGLVYLSMTAMRNVYLFAIGILPVLVYNLSSLKAKDLGIENFAFDMRKAFRVVSILGVLLLLPLSIRAGMDMSIKSPQYMSGSVDFLLEQNIQGNMFNNFDVGGYLIYRLYPERPVFVDNRPEAYPAEFFSQVYKPMQQNPEVWREMVGRYDIDYVVFGTTDQTPWGQSFLRIISNDTDWSIVYLDSYGLVALRRDVDRFGSIIKKYGKKLQ